MFDYKKQLVEIFEKDDSPLLKVTSKNVIISEKQKLIDIFLEINDFIDVNNREPSSNDNISERRLVTILKQIKSDFKKKKDLKEYDKHNLLGEVKEISSLEDIFANDHTDILNTTLEDELLDIKSFDIERAKADFVAKRKPCKNFENYRNSFKQIHFDLKSKNRKILKFEDRDLKEGRFFILDGIVLLLEKIEEDKIKEFKDKTQGSRKRFDPRIKCIFENGLESNMYLRSLQKLLYKNGKRISESQEEAHQIFNKNLGSTVLSGYIYVLKSLSDKQQIRNIPDLYKIGFSKNKVSLRIKNAKNETTFLNADVEIISETPIAGFNPHDIEKIIQSFFSKRKMNIEILDKNGKKVNPDEWFSVPINIIHQAINLLRKNELINHRYDELNKNIYKI